MALTVINSPLKARQPDKTDIYLRVLIGIAEKGISTEEERLKAFYHLVKYITSLRKTIVKPGINLFFLGNDLLKGVSTKKFAQYFPPMKVYDGKRYETKDYFSSLEALEKQGEVIKEPFEFLWDYQNNLIMFYVVAQMSALSDAHEQETGKSVFEEVFGVIPRRLHEVNGKKFLLDTKTGKTVPVKEVKKKTRWIKAVRGAKK